MGPIEDALIVVALCSVLSVAAYRFGLMTVSGAAASFFVGLGIGLFGTWRWLIILIAFAVLGFIVTRYRIAEKTEFGLQEGSHGERTYRNVIANGLVPLVIAISSFVMGAQGTVQADVAYITAMAVAASDTVASEMGVLSKDVRLITTMGRVPRGTNGGVSVYGTAWAIVGAFIAAVVGWWLTHPSDPLDPLISLIAMMGFVGCLLDSVVGATLETWGVVGKLGNNMMTMALGSFLALVALSML